MPQKTNERFNRQAKITWWNQTKIKNTNAIIVGCGGIGTWTALQLTMLGIRSITLVDMDKVEETNLNRQLFYEIEIGNNKVDALADKIQQINSKIKIKTHPARIETLPDEEIKKATYVFDCLDNIKTREHLSKKCWENKIPFIHSACNPVIGEIQLAINGKTSPMEKYPQEMIDDEDKRSCKDFDPAVCTTNMITASLQVDKFLDHLINNKTDKPITNYIRGNKISYA